MAMFEKKDQMPLLTEYSDGIDEDDNDDDIRSNDIHFNSIFDYFYVTIEAWRKLINALKLHLFYCKPETLSRRVIFVITIFLFLSYINEYYKHSMIEIEQYECNDVLDDCINVPFNDTLIPPYFDYLENYVISKKHHLSICLIQKVASTISTGLFCYLSNSEKFTQANRSIASEEYDHRFCYKQELPSHEVVAQKLGKYENIILVRDPYDRFVSGFMDKCVHDLNENYCFGCGTDLECFIRKEYRRFKRMTMSFPVYTLADSHFAPQTWSCDMKNTMNNSTIIKYGNVGEERTRMINDILKVLERNNVTNEEMDNVRKELSKGKTFHSTIGSSRRKQYERQIQDDPRIKRALIRMFYYDFQIFGFPM